jgi:two-component system, chemotaxis family, sensor histidine kinase and response regulator PixL
MSQDKEQEIRRQFLDEAQDYLDTLDQALLGIADRRMDGQTINAALRAAHSIKGGAGMMGYDRLSDLSHRLEDSFKVLKTQPQLEIAPELEALLLNAVHGLRLVIDCDRQAQPIDPTWFASDVLPIFDQLHDILGEPQAEDAVSILGTDDGRSIIPILFETEVDGCLQRLEAVLQHPEQPCLPEEVSILAQELGGLGDMLQLPAFSQLCESVLSELDRQPDATDAIAQAALAAWRQTQTLVLGGEFEHLPTAIVTDPTADLAYTFSSLVQPSLEPLTESFPEPFTESFTEPFAESVLEPPPADWQALLDADLTPGPSDAFSAMPFEVQATPMVEPTWEAPVEQASEFFNPRMADFTVSATGSPAAPEEDLDATVRVPLRQLNQLSDLFGEFTIERNGLDLYLKRLRGLTKLLDDRLRLLENSNTDLRSLYTSVLPSEPLLLSTGQAETKVGYTSPSRYPNSYASNGHSLNESSGLYNSTYPTNQRFDSLELDRYDNLHLLSQQVMETIVQIQEVSSDIGLNLDEVEQTARSLTSTSKQFQTNLMHLRMRPLSDILDRFPRALRELALQHGKRVRLNIVGGQTLIDRNILEALNDPLMHLLRNAFDHGIEDPAARLAQGKDEEGLIEIRASHRGNRTLITLRDDGGGIPLDKIRQRAEAMGLDASLLATASDEDLLSLIFEPGFSTRDQVTSLSGRGVGMDVVRDNLKQIRGEITVNTQAGVGTTFTLSVPFTLSVARVLLAESNGMLVAFPADSVKELLLLNPEDMANIDGREMLKFNHDWLPIVHLGRWLRFNCPRHPHGLETPPAINRPAVLLVNRGSETLALSIDRAWPEQEVAVRRIEGNLPISPGFSGCTVFGDGRVVPLVSIPELLNWITNCERSPSLPLVSAEALPALPSSHKQTVLIVDDSINVRRFLALTLERAGYRVEQAKDGQEALDKLSQGITVHGIVCDVEMPRLDGFGFLAKLKATPSLSQAPVAMLTSRSGEKHRQLATSLGAAAYFAKPYNEQALLATLATLMQAVVVQV